MEKEKVVNILKSKGYNAKEESGIVVINVQREENNEINYQKVKTLLEEIGYNSSWSFKTIKDMKETIKDSEIKEENVETEGSMLEEEI